MRDFRARRLHQAEEMRRHWRPGFPGPPDRPGHDQYWFQHRRKIMLRFLGFISIMALLIGGGMTTMAYLLTRFFGGDNHTVILVWIGGCALSVILPTTAIILFIRTFQSVALPLTDMVAAIDAVADGDLSVRVREPRRREMQRLANSLNHMIEELERTDQQRRNLTADVAHELRTPIHIIQGNLEGVLDGVYQPTHDHIEATLEETRLLTRLVDDLRTLSLAESGQLPLHRERVDLVDLLTDTTTSFSGQAEAAGINLEMTEPVCEQDWPDAFVIEGDADRLDQVLSNLLANAIRHTPAGGSIILSTAANDNGIRLTIADTGQGIPPADLPFIFDRFWRGDRARSHSGGVGSGLGLSIASQLIQAHGGHIEVSSQVDQGTTFVITFPNGHTE